MNYWRMAFRIGSRGHEMWRECKKRGIAAIGYYDMDRQPIVEDCSKLTEDEYNESWRRTAPRNTTGRASLRNVAYRMSIGDVIYAKQGREIVGRGTVTHSYKYNPSIFKGAKPNPRWGHFVRVKWDADFHAVTIPSDADLITVLRLEGERLRRLQAAIAARNRRSLDTIVAQDLDSLDAEETSFEEGSRKQRFTNYYERNPRLRLAAIRYHGTKCSICEFDFGEYYGDHGVGYIEVHHLRPVSRLGKKTTVSPKTDMSVLCSNCHRMIHRRKDKVLSLKEMGRLVQKAKQALARPRP